MHGGDRAARRPSWCRARSARPCWRRRPQRMPGRHRNAAYPELHGCGESTGHGNIRCRANIAICTRKGSVSAAEIEKRGSPVAATATPLLPRARGASTGGAVAGLAHGAEDALRSAPRPRRRRAPSVAKLTFADTPGRRFSTFSMRAAQAAHVITFERELTLRSGRGSGRALSSSTTMVQCPVARHGQNRAARFIPSLRRREPRHLRRVLTLRAGMTGLRIAHGRPSTILPRRFVHARGPHRR